MGPNVVLEIIELHYAGMRFILIYCTSTHKQLFLSLFLSLIVLRIALSHDTTLNERK